MFSEDTERDQRHETGQEAQNNTGKRNIKEGSCNLYFSFLPYFFNRATVDFKYRHFSIYKTTFALT